MERKLKTKDLFVELDSCSVREESASVTHNGDCHAGRKVELLAGFGDEARGADDRVNGGEGAALPAVLDVVTVAKNDARGTLHGDRNTDRQVPLLTVLEVHAGGARVQHLAGGALWAVLDVLTGAKNGASGTLQNDRSTAGQVPALTALEDHAGWARVEHLAGGAPPAGWHTIAVQLHVIAVMLDDAGGSDESDCVGLISGELHQPAVRVDDARLSVVALGADACRQQAHGYL